MMPKLNNEKGSIVVKPGVYIAMKCGYPHISPEAISYHFFVEMQEKTAEDIALEKGWHYSRKYGWLCNLEHNWRRIPKYAPVAQYG